MRTLNGTLRKVALLVTSVDEQAADDLLEQLPSETAAKVRRAIVELHDIDREEQHAVIAQFLAQSGVAAESSSDPADDGVELSPELERKLSSSSPASDSSESVDSASPNRPEEETCFAFLRQASSPDLAELLKRQHPQVATVVLAHVPPEKSAEVLSYFPSEHQISLLRRIADFQDVDHDVLRELEQQLEQQLSPGPTPLTAHLTPSPGTEIVQAILSAARDHGGEQLLSRLKEVDEALLSRLGLKPQVTEAQARGPLPVAEEGEAEPPASPQSVPLVVPRRRIPIQSGWQFADIMNLGATELAQLFQNVDPHSLLAALAGAEPHFVNRILGQLPTNDARRLREKLQQAQSWRADEILQAQVRLAQTATRMWEQGLLLRPTGRSVSRAA